MRPLRFLLRGFRSARDVVQPGLGPLERRVMDVLWQDGEVTVRDVCARFSDTAAYTTLMTTMDRLYKKGLLTRRKEGRAFRYAPAASREECELSMTADLVEGLLLEHRRTPLPLLSNLVEAVGDKDERLLDELERLVQEKRDRLREGGG